MTNAHAATKGRPDHAHASSEGRHLARGHRRAGAAHTPRGRARRHATTIAAEQAKAPTLTAVHATGTGARGGPPHRTSTGRHGQPSQRSAHEGHSGNRPASAAPPTKAAGPVVAPLRRLGKVISNVPGLSVFGGPLGWVLTGLLLLALFMVAAALLLGRRPLRSVRTPRG